MEQIILQFDAENKVYKRILADAVGVTPAKVAKNWLYSYWRDHPQLTEKRKKIYPPPCGFFKLLS